MMDFSEVQGQKEAMCGLGSCCSLCTEAEMLSVKVKVTLTVRAQSVSLFSHIYERGTATLPQPSQPADEAHPSCLDLQPYPLH